MTNKNDKILAPIKGRVIKFVEYQGIEKKNFFDKLGVASSNFRGNALYSEISADIIAKILTLYNNSNPEWLLTGKGSMLKSEETSRISQNITGNSNIQSGNNTSTIGDSSQQLKELQKQLKEKDREIERLKTQVDKLFKMIP